MIRTLDDFSRLAKEKGPKKLAVLAPEDEEFMKAVKESQQMGYIEPVLIGNEETIKKAADEVEFDIDDVEKIFEVDRQAIADLGTSMLFQGDVDISSKGQIPTSFIYRSIIKEESKAGTGRTISVISFWEIPGLDRLIAFTDTGVNINPDYRAKVEVLKNVVFLFQLLGYSRPRMSVLSGKREIGGVIDSYKDAKMLKRAADLGEFGECEILGATSFSEIFLGKKGRLTNYEDIETGNLPEVILVPSLDAGNIMVKLDFFLDVIRRSLVLSSRGPVLIPARSDFSDSITGGIAMGVVVADRVKGVI